MQRLCKKQLRKLHCFKTYWIFEVDILFRWQNRSDKNNSSLNTFVKRFLSPYTTLLIQLSLLISIYLEIYCKNVAWNIEILQQVVNKVSYSRMNVQSENETITSKTFDLLLTCFWYQFSTLLWCVLITSMVLVYTYSTNQYFSPCL